MVLKTWQKSLLNGHFVRSLHLISSHLPATRMHSQIPVQAQYSGWAQALALVISYYVNLNNFHKLP